MSSDTLQAFNPEDLTVEQIDLIKRTICHGASDDELKLFVFQCNRTKLDPFSRQIYSMAYGGRRSVVISIDGARLIAERSGRYQGQTPQEWCGADGIWRDVWLRNEPPSAARIGVYRSGNPHPTYAVANFKAYRPAKSSMWDKMPELMISKCFDEQTEILTEQGFVKFSAIQNERIAQVTEHGMEFVRAKPFKQSYSGDMILFDSDDLNFCVTPNHDMVTTCGRIEAGTMFELSRARPSFYIPRLCPETDASELDMTDAELELAAAFMCDGSHLSESSFRIAVSRNRKIDKIRSWELHSSERIKNCAGKTSVAFGGRTITTKADQLEFKFSFSNVNKLCLPGKRISISAVEKISSRQAKIFIDAWIFFDGNWSGIENDGRTPRIYTGDRNHSGAVEVLAVKAGYSISRHTRQDKEWGRHRYEIALSSRDEIPVKRWGRWYKYSRAAAEKNTLKVVQNESGSVWCVTVPSGTIIVRRNGFSMLCGNCAELLALRKAFPQELSGLYSEEEMQQSEKVAVSRQPAQLQSEALAVWQKAKEKFNGKTKEALMPILQERYQASSFAQLNKEQLADLSDWVESVNV